MGGRWAGEDERLRSRWHSRDGRDQIMSIPGSRRRVERQELEVLGAAPIALMLQVKQSLGVHAGQVRECHETSGGMTVEMRCANTNEVMP